MRKLNFVKALLIAVIALLGGGKTVAQTYSLVTDASTLKAGDEIIITNGKSGDVYAMKPWGGKNNCSAEEITINSEGKIVTPSPTIAKITLGGTDTAGEWTLYDGTYYLYAASKSSNNLKGRKALGTDKNDIAKIEIEKTNNNAVIKFQGKNTRNIIRYNENKGNDSGPLFSCYKEGQAEIYIFRKANTFTIGDDKFATFYSADAYIMPEGVTGGTITAADTQSGKLTINYTYTEGTTVPAKTALLLKGEPKTYYYAKTTSSDTAPAGNLLHGADAVDAQGKTFVDGTNVKYYILSHSTDATKKLGFYWAAADGAAISYQEPYAFLAIDAAGSAPIMLSIDGDDDTTAINGITNDTITDNTMYNLAGQRVNANAKGIIIINGKKVIKR